MWTAFNCGRLCVVLGASDDAGALLLLLCVIMTVVHTTKNAVEHVVTLTKAAVVKVNGVAYG